MISTIEYTSSIFTHLVEFCKSEFNTHDAASANMWANNWESRHNTLPYLLKYTDRFSGNNGKFYLLLEYDKIIGCSGVYTSNFSDRVAMAGVRSWLTKKYRKKQLVRDYLLPAHKSWAIAQNLDVVALSFNEYNRNLIKMFQAGQTLYTRTPANMFYSNFNVLPYPILVQSVPQWIIYETLNKDIDWLKYRAA